MATDTALAFDAQARDTLVRRVLALDPGPNQIALQHSVGTVVQRAGDTEGVDVGEEIVVGGWPTDADFNDWADPWDIGVTIVQVSRLLRARLGGRTIRVVQRPYRLPDDTTAIHQALWYE